MTDEDDIIDTGGLDERRLHIKIFDHWVSLLAGRDFPALDEMQSEMEDEILGLSFVIDLAPGLARAVVRYVGEDLILDHGVGSNLEGKRIKDLGRFSLIARLADHYLEVISNRAPIAFEAEFEREGGRRAAYRGILLPFSSNDTDIDHILGVVSWIEKDSIH